MRSRNGCVFLGWLAVACFAASPPSLLRSRSPFATDCSGLPSNSVSVDTTHSSMRSYISSTSTPSLRKISRCGLLRAAAKPSAVM